MGPIIRKGVLRRGAGKSRFNFLRNTVENNFRLWNDDYDWSKHGDEWDGQARFCGQPYDRWKQSIIDTFIAPNAAANSVILEIGPGHGRWSRILAGRCRQLILVDLSPQCIQFCKNLLSAHEHVKFFANDGHSLKEIEDEGIDFVWSFDSFVHMDKRTIGCYLTEIARVLKRDGKAVLHHAGRRHGFLWLGFLVNCGRFGRSLYTMLSIGRFADTDGWRSNVSKQMFNRLAHDGGLRVEAQIQSWGEGFGIPRFGDYITTLKRR